ncbi:hypothetical protein AcV7_001434 [Taiwanofungus camphoratus]|nr:hypothetical protein AcV7_001434 [Antrodia cinnamomea]
MIAGSHSHGSRSGGNWSAAKGGDIQVDKPGQQVLQRSSIVLSNDGLEARFTIGLPAQGRTILGDWAAEIFRTAVPALTEGLLYSSQEKATLQQFVDCIEDQEDLRCQATKAGLVAFVANGAVLPRASGALDEPMASPSVVTFQSPPNLEQSFNLPHRGEIRGMGVPAGITMIAGGGFHGKSTLLDALAVGCYNHIPGDGREFVVTSNNCVSVQGEDGRSITNVDISPFITNLPGGVSTTSFSTKDASGSTSMAAGVIEALELGADILLFDEDTCATNFLIRDLRMQRLISADPITPLIFKIRAMFEDHGCSSILVIGGCGDYCDVADLVLEMRRYQCYDITEAARIVAKEIPSVVSSHQIRAFGVVSPRALISQSLPSAERKMAVRRRAIIEAGDETLDLLGLVQLVHSSQTRAIASALKFLYSDTADASAISLPKCLERLDHIILTSKMDALMENNKIDGFLARPRILEIGMAINRLRTVSLKY